MVNNGRFFLCNERGVRMNEQQLERESEAPVNWEDNFVMVRDGRGKVTRLMVRDDTEEVSSYVAND